MPKEYDAELETHIIDILREAGDDVPIQLVREQLNQKIEGPIPATAFSAAQKRLIDARKIVRMRRGVQAALALRQDEVQSENVTAFKEADTYKAVEVFLHKHFVPDVIDPVPQMVDYVVQITATSGPTAGLWTRPDLALATVTRYRFAAQPDLELYGFEVKKEEGCTVYAIHEALAHAAFVHYATVVAILPETSVFRRNLSRMREQAAEHGVGLIVISDMSSTPLSYDVMLEPRRLNPPLWRVDEFIETRFEKDLKQKLVSWLHVKP